MQRLLAASLALNVLAVGLLAAGLLAPGRHREDLVAHAEGKGGAAPLGNGDVDADGTINITDAIYLLRWLFTGGPPPEPIERPPCDSCCPPPGGGALPATGQTECYGFVEGQGWVTVPCEGAEIPGQDGAYRAGCPMDGRFVDHGDGTVTDTCTGRMWQRETTDVDGNGSIDDEDRVTWEAALRYCEGLGFAGHDDWRLPDVRELQSIVDYGRCEPAIDPALGALSRGYWSSTTYAVFPAYAWLVTFRDGLVYSYVDVDKDFLCHIRAVRGPR